jgi:cell division ATPase FtsA
MSSLFIVIREKYLKMSSYLILDLGGEITDVFIVDEGIPKNIISFPYGRQSLYRDLKKELNKNRAETMSLFSLYMDGSLEDKQKIVLEKALYEVQKSWAHEFEIALMSIPEPRMIPNSVFLVMNKDVHPMFFKMFAEKNELVYKIFKNDCNVLGLNGPDFLGLCRVNDGLCDPMLMIQALSVKRKYIK